MLGLCRCDFYTFAMEPSLAHITANPKLASTIVIPTGPTSCTMFIIFFPTLILFFGWWRHLHSLGQGLRLSRLLMVRGSVLHEGILSIHNTITTTIQQPLT